MILTVSRMDGGEERQPGLPRLPRQRLQRHARRSCCSSGRSSSSGRPRCAAIRRDVRPRGHRGGIYPFLRAAMCVVVRDLIVYGVLTDMMKGRPAVYATFSSYDEVAHHSGLERADTLEALRKLDEQFGRIERARRYAPRPVRDRRALRPRPDPGRDLQAAQRLRARRARRAVARARRRRPASRAATSNDAMVGHALGEATGGGKEKRPKNDVSDRDVVVLGSGNLGLVYLMEERRRLTLRGDRRAAPAAAPGAARASAHRLAARPLVRARRRRARRDGAQLPRRRPRRGRGSAGALLARPRRSICCAPTASSTSPTSWSAASTTPRSRRAARSRS